MLFRSRTFLVPFGHSWQFQKEPVLGEGRGQCIDLYAAQDRLSSVSEPKSRSALRYAVVAWRALNGLLVSPAIVTRIWRKAFWLLMDASPPNVRVQPQPPERYVACKDDVQVFIISQLPRAAVVKYFRQDARLFGRQEACHEA